MKWEGIAFHFTNYIIIGKYLWAICLMNTLQNYSIISILGLFW
ncbi:hypothetical protein HMPREF0971_02356 [Segatella oris F0302]|uniref:Uncharacterized protein n=1 Tax=Segatella oris F0302 TaxID=649760 RepID=D1QTM7_9BACT|nr:hypothetical protein HMPREF0971_02356 [Segatella oris F0302]